MGAAPLQAPVAKHVLLGGPVRAYPGEQLYVTTAVYCVSVLYVMETLGGGEREPQSMISKIKKIYNYHTNYNIESKKHVRTIVQLLYQLAVINLTNIKQ